MKSFEWRERMTGKQRIYWLERKNVYQIEHSTYKLAPRITVGERLLRVSHKTMLANTTAGCGRRPE
jgi:hypothetical protein